MKGIITILVMLTSLTMAQNNDTKVYKSGWYLGAGGIYPRYMTISDKSIASHNTHGFYLSLGYNITEHFGFRLKPNYVRLHSFFYAGNGNEMENFTRMGSLNLEAVYSILPCDMITPYFLIGYGITYFKSHNPFAKETRPLIKDAFVGYQAVLGVGAELKLWNDISIKTEFDYITASNNKIDGNDHINDVKGILQSNGDSYMNLSLGATWYFSRGKRSKICEPFGIREVITEVPVEIEKVIIDTVYVDKIIEKAVVKRESFIIENVRFKFDQDILTKEAELILKNVANVLNKYPEEKFEILGHTDSWGSDKYNMGLSERRAISVKKYLVAHGVDATRLYPAGCGERKPIADNDTPEGRAVNRRIEFKIYDSISTKCPKIEENIKLKDNSTGADFTDAEEKKIAETLMKGEQLSFTNVRFKFDSDELTEPSKVILDNVVNVINKLPDLKLEVQGHTDSDGGKPTTRIYHKKEQSL